MNERRRILQTAHALLNEGNRVVLVTVSQVRGSTPREVGAKMLVTPTTTSGSIGGGELEFQAIATARELLCNASGSTNGQERQYPLGTNCGQCCGGVASLLFQPLGDIPAWLTGALQSQQPTVLAFPLNHDGTTKADLCMALDPQQPDTPLLNHARQLHDQQQSAARVALQNDDRSTSTYLLEIHGHSQPVVAVFGAGHVGCAVIDILKHLDLELVWVDNRADVFAAQGLEAVNLAPHPQPAVFASQLPPGSLALVMTHSHALDFDICTALLQRTDIPFCGLIGSASKRQRFERLLRQGELEHLAARLTCPIGVDVGPGKAPYEIAIAVAAQIMREVSQDVPRTAATIKEVTRAAVSN